MIIEPSDRLWWTIYGARVALRTCGFRNLGVGTFLKYTPPYTGTFFTAERGSGDAKSEGGPSTCHEVDLVAPFLGAMQHVSIRRNQMRRTNRFR
jgi:hypothetical protein